jgi:ectoine hydroxylase-related dioxygenase (phytanoyl-CoA dioxygenase family)
MKTPYQNMYGDQLLKDFKEQGFVLIRNFFSPEEIDFLLKRIQDSKSSSSEILTRGAMTFRSQIFMHDASVQEFVSQQKIIDFLRIFAGPDIWIRWDQAVAKGPGADVFPWHQDNGYNGLRSEFYQFWISLTKTTEDNGALLLKPGSHRQSLPHQKIGKEMVYSGSVSDPVLINAEPGDIVLFSSFMLHSTTPNITQSDRWAYVIEYMRLDDYDPTLKPPYFVVSRNGKSCMDFVDYQEGGKSILNRLKALLVRNPY